MRSPYNKLISVLLGALLLGVLILFNARAYANTAHIQYTDTNMYNKIKGELESEGYTVTGTSGGSVSLSDFTGKDLHINVAGNNNCGNNCKTAYETYIGAGGNVIIAGDGTHNSNRSGSIEALIESKLNVGAITLFTNNANYLAHAHGSQYSDTSNYWVTRNVFRMTSGGTPLADNSSGSLSTWRNWAVYSYGSNGGKLIVTFDQAQFNHTGNNNSSTWSTRFYNFLTTTLSHESITSATINITPTTSQSSIITTDKAKTGNGVKMNVDGDSNTINIEQHGENNFIIGTDWSSDSQITGNNNVLNIDQGNVTTSGNSGNNGIALDVTGNTNTLNISQGDYGTDTGDHRIWLDIDGNTNTMTLTQRNDGTTSSEHYMNLDIDSGSNIITMQQLDNGDKTLFLDINNSNNTVDITQSGTGEHFLDLKLDTGNYAHDVDITQQGSGNHAGRVELDGYSTDFDLMQQGSTDQDYNINMTCGTVSGCTLSTTQGN
tara:strand:- start:934 stop:2403 length:1470 start_codon:yes stop_codon:yes gene_type:complete